MTACVQLQKEQKQLSQEWKLLAAGSAFMCASYFIPDL